MRNRDFHSLMQKTVVADLGYVSVRGVCIRKPFNDILSGLALDTSAYSKNDFYIWYFSLPLYIPTSFIYFSLGDRLISGIGTPSMERWNAVDPNLLPHLNRALEEQALPFLRQASSPQGLIDALISYGWEARKTAIEATAYSFVRIGEFEKAKGKLEEFISELEPDEIEHDIPKKERAELLLHALRHDPQKAQDQLSEWVDETLTNLRLRDYWDGPSPVTAV